MGKTSNATKQKWCKEHYAQVKVCVPPETAAIFKTRCKADGVSMASEIARFMRGQNSESYSKKKQELRVVTRPQRRKTLALLIRNIDAIMDAEINYRDNIPESLRNSCRYEAAEQTVAALEEALNILITAYE